MTFFKRRNERNRPRQIILTLSFPDWGWRSQDIWAITGGEVQDWPKLLLHLQHISPQLFTSKFLNWNWNLVRNGKNLIPWSEFLYCAQYLMVHCNWETNFLTFRNIIRTATTFALMGWGMRRAPTSKKNMISIIQGYMCWHWETNLWIIWVFDKVFLAKAIKLWHV